MKQENNIMLCHQLSVILNMSRYKIKNVHIYCNDIVRPDSLIFFLQRFQKRTNTFI